MSMQGLKVLVDGTLKASYTCPCAHCTKVRTAARAFYNLINYIQQEYDSDSFTIVVSESPLSTVDFTIARKHAYLEERHDESQADL